MSRQGIIPIHADRPEHVDVRAHALLSIAAVIPIACASSHLADLHTRTRSHARAPERTNIFAVVLAHPFPRNSFFPHPILQRHSVEP